MELSYENLDDDKRGLTMTLLQTTWITRNKLIFEEKRGATKIMLDRAVDSWNELLDALRKDKSEEGVTGQAKMESWVAPQKLHKDQYGCIFGSFQF